MEATGSQFLSYFAAIFFCIVVIGTIGWALSDLPDSGSPSRKPVSDYERRAIILTSLIALVTAAYVFTTELQWNAMRRSNTLIQQQLETADRPWIKFLEIDHSYLQFRGPSFPGHFFAPTDTVFFNLTPKFENVGRSTAVHVKAYFDFRIKPWGPGWGDDFSSAEKEACSRAANWISESVVCPHDSFDDLGFGTGAILTANNISVSSSGVRYIAPVIVGCIDYQYSSLIHHQTAFVYEMFRADDNTRVFVVGQNMKGDQIIFVRDPQYDIVN